MADMFFNDLLIRFNRLDEDANLLFEDDTRFHLIVIGGSALILHGFYVRATRDIDSISVSKELYPLLGKYDINTLSQAFINCLPYNFEDRLTLVFNGKKVDVFAASLEDIVIAKLYASRPIDVVDLTTDSIIQNIDWELLDFLATDSSEAWSSRLNDRNYEIFLDAYNDYKRKYSPCVN